MPLVDLPHSLDRETQRQISEAYEQAIDDVGADELQYIRQRLPKVIKRLNKEPGSWLAQMASVTTVLTDVAKTKQLNQRANREVVAALFYLCNPFDVIPDHDPEKGYWDDAFMLNLCLKRMKKSDPESYQAVERQIGVNSVQ